MINTDALWEAINAYELSAGDKRTDARAWVSDAIKGMLIGELETITEEEHMAMSCYWPTDEPEAIMCPAHRRIAAIQSE